MSLSWATQHLRERYVWPLEEWLGLAVWDKELTDRAMLHWNANRGTACFYIVYYVHVMC